MTTRLDSPKPTAEIASDIYSKYAEANLSVFPVRINGGTIVPPQSHQKYGANVPSKVDLATWRNTDTHMGAPSSYGLAMGKSFDPDHRIVCLDVDHPSLVAAIQYLFPSPCGRFGSKGIGLFYKVPRDDKDMKKSRNFMVHGRNQPAVEFLSTGRFTFIPPSTHRKTGKEYQWVGRPLLNVIDQLPMLTTKDLRIIQTIVALDVDGGTLESLLAGEGTHYPTLSLAGALVALGMDAERIVRAMTLLFPTDYQGDTLRQIPEMVESAFRKGFDKKQSKPTDAEELTDDELNDMFIDWHYVTNINRMVNVMTRDVFDKERFDAVMGRNMRRAMNVYTAWPNASIKKSLTYFPGYPPIVDDMINMWRPTELNPKAGDVTYWLEHIEAFYAKEEVEHLLNWLAYCVQKPTVKPGHAVLMGSQFEGVGKDLWLLPIRACFGKQNVSEIGADSLSSSFNEWLAHKHLIIIQEIWTGARRELSNQLKPLLSSPPDEIMVNEKNVSRYPIPNICAAIMLTNHKDAVSMAAEDRRYFVMWSEARPHNSDYYKEFALWVTDSENQSHVYDYLLKRDISKFNIKAAPPKTTAKLDMVDATMTRSENLVVVVRDIFADMGLKEVVSENGLYDQLREIAPDVAREVLKIPRSSPRYPIRKALKMLGYATMKTRASKKVNGKVRFVTVLVVEDRMEEFEKARPTDLYDMVQHPVEY